MSLHDALIGVAIICAMPDMAEPTLFLGSKGSKAARRGQLIQLFNAGARSTSGGAELPQHRVQTAQRELESLEVTLPGLPELTELPGGRCK